PRQRIFRRHLFGPRWVAGAAAGHQGGRRAPPGSRAPGHHQAPCSGLRRRRADQQHRSGGPRREQWPQQAPLFVRSLRRVLRDEDA
ncbi:unnamed protein product, partial [Symbiodinium sp. CCMP2456]